MRARSTTRTAAEVWQRFRAGERGMLGRHSWQHFREVPEADTKRKVRELSGAGLLRLLTIKPLIGKQERQDRVDRNHGPQ
jgi:hypothetical protein